MLEALVDDSVVRAGSVTRLWTSLPEAADSHR